jgi:hypothetical protein
MDGKKTTQDPHANGLAVRLLVRDLENAVLFQREVLGARVAGAGAGEALVHGAGGTWRLRADRSEAVGALRDIVALVVRRGAGIELRVNVADPAACETRARELGFGVLTPVRDVGGVLETQLVDGDGYVWSACTPS